MHFASRWDIAGRVVLGLQFLQEFVLRVEAQQVVEQVHWRLLDDVLDDTRDLRIGARLQHLIEESVILDVAERNDRFIAHAHLDASEDHSPGVDESA